MRGMSITTGKALDGLDHLKQSIRDILTTPIGSRVMQRDYGSRLFELVDRPTSPGFELDLYAATAEALQKWEPRFALTRVQVTNVAEGQITLSLEGTLKVDGSTLILEAVHV